MKDPEVPGFCGKATSIHPSRIPSNTPIRVGA